jgi:hypothetical protein
VAPSLAAGSRRARFLLALHGHQLSLETGLTVREPFPVSPFTFVPDDTRNYTQRRARNQGKSVVSDGSQPPSHNSWRHRILPGA